MSDCPVCGKVGVDQAATRCPQCHADLECFALLDALHEGPPVPAVQADLKELKQPPDRPREDPNRGAPGHGGRYSWLLLGVFGSLAALILVTQIIVLDLRPTGPPAPEPVATTARLDTITAGIERLAGRLATIEGRLDALATEQAGVAEQARTAGAGAAQIASTLHGIENELDRLSVATAPETTRAATAEPTASVEEAHALVLHHHLRRDETLWSVAKRYYGQGQLYPVLIALNPGVGPYHRGTGVLRILDDPEEAAELYRRITPPGGEGRLFRYRVEPGDDWRELARRFLGRPSRAPELAALNPKSELKPGEQVLIALE